MFIFITPKIVRNPADIAGVTLEKSDMMESVMPDADTETMYTRENKQHAIILTERGFAKLLDNKLREAREYFEEALGYDSQNPYTLLNIGVVSERERKYKEAFEYYQKVITTGTKATAVEASDPDKQGLPLIRIARENIERLQQEMKTRQ